jgi:hypothetical protein
MGNKELIKEFEEWIDSQVMTEDDGDDYWVISPSVHSTFAEVQDKFNDLKIKHLPLSETPFDNSNTDASKAD